MKHSAYKGSASFDAVIKRAREAKGRDDDGWRAEFIRLVETAQLLRDHPNGPSRSDSPDVDVDTDL